MGALPCGREAPTGQEAWETQRKAGPWPSPASSCSAPHAPQLQYPARGHRIERGHQPQHLVTTPAQAWPPPEVTTAWAPTPPGHPLQATGALPRTTPLPFLGTFHVSPLSLSLCVHPGLLPSQTCPFTSHPGTLAPPCSQSRLLHQPGHVSPLRAGSVAASLVCTAHG